MADDWKPGDLALCVSVTHPAWPGQASDRLRAGAVYTVTKVGKPIKSMGGERALGFAEVSPRLAGRGFPESVFRKIHPHAPDAEDAETIRLLTGQPVREPATARRAS